MSDKVKCTECGFLAVRKISSQELCEATTRYREKGDPPPGLAGDRFEQAPVCFAMAHNLQREYEAPIDSIPQGSPRRALICIAAERTCPSFTAWQQGFTPKEHAEMIRQRALLDWQRDEAQRQRDWQAEQARLADERHAEQLAAAERHQRDNLRVVAEATTWNWRGVLLAAAIGAVATLIAGVLGALATLITLWATSGS